MLQKQKQYAFTPDKWNAQRLIRNQYLLIKAVNLADSNVSGALSYLALSDI